MKNNKELTHEGVVSKKDGRDAWVKIIAKSACAGCHAKGACSVADVEEKIVHVRNAPSDTKVGDSVILVANKKQEKLALFLGYVLPLCIIILSLILLRYMNVSDTISAIIALTILIPYYSVLFLFKKRIADKLEFSIRKI